MADSALPRVVVRLASYAIVDPPEHPCAFGSFIPASVARPEVGSILAVESGVTLAQDGVCIGRGCRVKVGPGGRLRIGRGTYIGEDTQVFAGRSVTIGRNCPISWYPPFFDDGRGSGAPTYSAPIVVEDDVWIGTRAIVLKGVTLGAGSELAVGSVVTRACPPRSLIADVPPPG